MPELEIDPDIRKARTLPTDFYVDARYFDLARERIFSRCWHFAGRVETADNLRPITLLPGYLDEPLLLVKDGDSLACLSNVCTHRGKLLVEEPCSANLIRCGYHGRRFSLDGKFLSMPEFDEVEDFPSEADNLKRLAIAEAGGFLFTSLDAADSFDAFAGEGLAPFDAVSPQIEFRERRDYEIDAHWALYCENYLEGFHIPYVHKGLNAVVDYGSYATETYRYSSLQTAFSEPGTLGTGASVADERAPVTTVPGGSDNIAARYLFIFPNLMFNFYPWGVSVNVVRPVTPSKTVVEFYPYVSDDSLIESSAGADLHGVEMEDEAVVESVQKGIRSRFYSHGRYSPTREQGTHHFHRLIAEFMG